VDLKAKFGFFYCSSVTAFTLSEKCVEEEYMMWLYEVPGMILLGLLKREPCDLIIGKTRLCMF
jgi:hypothetical protein